MLSRTTENLYFLLTSLPLGSWASPKPWGHFSSSFYVPPPRSSMSFLGWRSGAPRQTSRSKASAQKAHCRFHPCYDGRSQACNQASITAVPMGGGREPLPDRNPVFRLPPL